MVLKRSREPFLASSPDFQQVPFDDLAALGEALDETVAAVILEPTGAAEPADGYLGAVRELTGRETFRLYGL